MLLKKPCQSMLRFVLFCFYFWNKIKIFSHVLDIVFVVVVVVHMSKLSKDSHNYPIVWVKKFRYEIYTIESIPIKILHSFRFLFLLDKRPMDEDFSSLLLKQAWDKKAPVLGARSIKSTTRNMKYDLMAISYRKSNFQMVGFVAQ